jgi:hypothetical protein
VRKKPTSEIERLYQLHPAIEYHEDDGFVLWWNIPVDEPPVVGGIECSVECGGVGNYFTELPDPCGFRGLPSCPT